MKKVAVIGAGITGLTAAHALHEAGCQVSIFERGSRVGGAVWTHEEGGFLVEHGPNTMLVNKPELESYLHELGLGPSLRKADAAAKKRFLVKNGEVHPVPMSPPALLKTPLLSPMAKLRLLAEPFQPRHRADLIEESVASFVRRRLGREVVEQFLNPLVAGIYAGDPNQLSVQAAFPFLPEIEDKHRSLLIGAITKMREKKRQGPAFKSYSASFEKGLRELPEALALCLPEGAIRLQTTIDAIAFADRRWKISWTSLEAAGEAEAFDALVMACPLRALLELPLPHGLESVLDPLRRVHYPPVDSLAFGFRRADVNHPLDGYGVLVPEREKENVLGVLFSSSLFYGRAPQGHVLLTCFLGGVRQPEITDIPFDQLKETVLRSLWKLLGVVDRPVFVHHTHWPRAIPQYELGHLTRLRAAEQAERDWPFLFLGGNWRGGASVGQCVLNGRELGKRSARRLYEGISA